MFVVNCPQLDREVVVFDRLIDARTPTRHGTVVEFRCPCGGSGVRLNDPGAVSGRMVHHQSRSAAA